MKSLLIDKGSSTFCLRISSIFREQLLLMRASQNKSMKELVEVALVNEYNLVFASEEGEEVSRE